MQTHIQTTNSFLTTQLLPSGVSIEDCVNEIRSKLQIKPEIILYGKVVHQNRDVGFFSNTSIGYKYSGKLAASQPLTPTLANLLSTVNILFNAQFNGILVNRYDDGNNYISLHSDDETGLDQAGVVAISYGSVRKFRIRDKVTKAIVQDIPTIPGEIICMGGQFQREFTHEIPIEKRIKGTRYSFTFRKHMI